MERCKMKRLPSVSVKLASIICIAGFILLWYVLIAAHTTGLVKSCFIIYSIGLMVVTSYWSYRIAEWVRIRNTQSVKNIFAFFFGKLFSPRALKIFEKIRTEHQDTIDKIRGSLFREASPEDELVISLINRLLSALFDLPDFKYGQKSLFSYSLLVAVHSLEDFETRVWRMETPEGTRDGVKTIMMRDKWKLGVCISALASNLGRVYEAEVSSRKASAEVWNPGREELYTFALRHKEYGIKLKPTQENFHKIPTNYLLHYIVNSDVAEELGEEVFFEVLDSLSPAPNSKNRIFPVVEEGNKLTVEEISKSKEAVRGGRYCPPEKKTKEN